MDLGENLSREVAHIRYVLCFSSPPLFLSRSFPLIIFVEIEYEPREHEEGVYKYDEIVVKCL